MTYIPKTALGEKTNDSRNSILNAIDKNILYIGEVRSVTDNLDSGKIQVRIKGVDDKVLDKDLPYSYPLLPININIIPKIGEGVKIFLLRSDKTTLMRQYIGPIISQPQRLNKDPLYFTALSNSELGQTPPLAGVSTIPDANGVYAQKDEIAFQGRDNADVIFKPAEVIIRAGKFELNNPVKANLKNPAYIQLKLSSDSSGGTQSVQNIVADKINLITHDGSPRFNTIIDDATLKDILKNAHPVPYGDNLIVFLKLIQEFVGTHIHPYDALPPNVGVGKVPEILNFDLNTLISKNVKVN